MNEEFGDFKNLCIPMDEYEMVCLLKHLDAITKKGTRVRDAYKLYLKYDENKKKILYNVNKKDEFLDKIGLYVGKLF